MIEDPRGQWAHPGKNTRIPGNQITMEGVDYPVWAVPDVGEPVLMQPGQSYTFPGASYVDEYPMLKQGGELPKAQTGLSKFLKYLKPNFTVPSKIINKSNKFKSEINWSNWNKDIPKNKALMDEYADIEKFAKTNSTWMKNADGSPFTLPDGSPGLPEQFVQVNSKDFKKAFPEGYSTVYRGTTKYNPTLIDKKDKGYTGVFTGNKELARNYNGSLNYTDDFYFNSNTPEDLRFNGLYELAIPKSSNSLKINANKQHWTEIPLTGPGDVISKMEYNIKAYKDMLTRAKKSNSKKAIERYQKRVADLEDELQNIKSNNYTTEKELQTVRDKLGEFTSTDDLATYMEKQGLSNIQIDDVLDGIFGDVTIANQVPGNYAKSLRGNNGMFDMTNPNIYKALIPLLGVAGLGLPENKFGGEYETKELTDAEIEEYVKGGYIVEEELPKAQREDNIEGTFVNSKEHGVDTPVYIQVEEKESPIHGTGVFSKEPISKGQSIGVSHIRKEFEKNGEMYQAPFPSKQIGGYNHSEEPNVTEVDNGDHISLIAIRDIQPGEELLSNYDDSKIPNMERSSDFTRKDVPKAQDGHSVKQRRGVRDNYDYKAWTPSGLQFPTSVSSHLMAAEYVDGRGWVAFPTLFQDSKPYADDQENWKEVSGENGWWPIYQEALKRGEVYDFGEDKEAALAFGRGSWKDQLPEHLQDKQEGGFQLELTPEEIDKYVKGGYVVEELPKAKLGLISLAKPLITGAGSSNKIIQGLSRGIIDKGIDISAILAPEIMKKYAKHAMGLSSGNEHYNVSKFLEDLDSKKKLLETYSGKETGFPGHQDRSLVDLYFGDDSKFKESRWLSELESKDALKKYTDYHGPLKSYELLSNFANKEPLSGKKLFGRMDVADPQIKSHRTYDEFTRWKDEIIEQAVKSKNPDGLIGAYNTLFDEFGEILPFESSFKDGYLPNFGLWGNPIEPIDDIGGHMTFVRRITPKKFDFTTRDVWGFHPKDYVDKWIEGKSEIGAQDDSYFKDLAPRLLNKFGKPFILTQTNPLHFDLKKGGQLPKAQVGTISKALKKTLPFATKFDDVVVNSHPFFKTNVLKDPLLQQEMLKHLATGIEPIQNYVGDMLYELKSPEGKKRLLKQESEHLEHIGYPKNFIDKQAELNYKARLQELELMGNVRNSASVASKFLDQNRLPEKDFFNSKYLYSNASYTNPNNIYLDAWAGDINNYDFFNLNKTQLGEKALPGFIRMGVDYSSPFNTPILAHEIRGHGLQRGRKLQIDRDALKMIRPKKELNENQQKAYDYFKKSGKEPSAYLNELREAMLLKGLIKHRYENITPEKLQVASTFFKRNPMGVVKSNNSKSYLSNTRILDFMEESPEMYQNLSWLLNRLPTVGLGLGAAGAAGSTLEEKKLGGELPKAWDGRVIKQGSKILSKYIKPVDTYNKIVTGNSVLPYALKLENSIIPKSTDYIKKITKEQIKEAQGFLRRRQFIKNLQKEGLIGENFNDLNYAARSTKRTEELTKLALDHNATRYRAVTGKVPHDGKGMQEHTRHKFDMSVPNYPNSISEFENMKNAGVDFNDPLSIAKYQVAHVPMDTYGYRSGMHLMHNVDALFATHYPDMSGRYGNYQFKMKSPRDFSEGSYNDWFSKYYKPNKTWKTDGGVKDGYYVHDYMPSNNYDMPLHFSASKSDGSVVGLKGSKMFDIDETYPFADLVNLNPQQKLDFVKYIKQNKLDFDTGWKGKYEQGGDLPKAKYGKWMKYLNPPNSITTSKKFLFTPPEELLRTEAAWNMMRNNNYYSLGRGAAEISGLRDFGKQLTSRYDHAKFANKVKQFDKAIDRVTYDKRLSESAKEAKIDELVKAQNEVQKKLFNIQDEYSKFRLDYSGLPITQARGKHGDQLAGGQGRLFNNLLNDKEYIKFGKFFGDENDMQNLINAGKKFNSSYAEAAFPTEAFRVGEDNLQNSKRFVQFMPKLDYSSGLSVDSDVIYNTVKELNDLGVGLDYMGLDNIGSVGDKLGLVDLSYIGKPGERNSVFNINPDVFLPDVTNNKLGSKELVREIREMLVPGTGVKDKNMEKWGDGRWKEGGSVELGDIVDEATMKRLKAQGYTFEEI